LTAATAASVFRNSISSRTTVRFSPIAGSQGFPLMSSILPTYRRASRLFVSALILCAFMPGSGEAQQARVRASTASPGSVTALDTARLRGLRYRMIGPARGGRVTTVTGVPQEPLTFYMGSTGGGVWKTINAGQSWTNVSDGYFEAASMGSIDVADSDPNVIYAGTGSDGIRSNVSIGKGIYKSIDAGKTWSHVGLRDVGQIGAVVIHPTNPEVVYVAAIGNPFKPNPDRGVYRTRDGGRTWQKVLYVSDSTGAVDLELEPGNPSVVYAAMWRAERKPWTIISGSREGGIYKSTDGGDTWNRLGNGLPSGLVGKADFAVSAAKPERLYVLIEANPGGGLYRSDDAGGSFIAVDTVTKGLITRPFYYTNIDADPRNADVVYVGTEGFYKSSDGGKTWSIMSTPHGDNHDLWINPLNSSFLIQSNDGGANASVDGGRTWSTLYNQPTAEIYQVYVDNQYPYRVYGAQQDNTTLIVPSLPAQSSPPDDPLQSWRTGPGCETGPIFPHISNPDTVYGSCKGQFSRLSLRTGQEKQYWVGAQSIYGMPGKDLIYRFQRVSPMEASPHDARTLYYGSQYVHRTRDEGATWERISPDLTWNPPERQQKVSGEPITIDVTGEEFYSTLYAIRESPIRAGVIWTGANDGPFSVTRDNGKTWKRITPASQPPGCRVQNIEPSPHRAGSAYYSVLCYLLGDFRPYLWRTDDYGTSWTLLTTGTNGIPANHPTRVVREDPEREGLLYAGTEFGMWVSFDNGAQWSPLQLNLPVTPVTDLKVHRGDLVISTQGRSFWILDDITPLRQMSDAVAAKASHLFTPRDAYRYRYIAAFGGAEANRASTSDPQYPQAGAMIDYWVSAAAGPVTVEIVAPDGSVVRKVSSDAPAQGSDIPAAAQGAQRLTHNAGLNRFIWNMQYPGPWDSNASRSGRFGPMAAPGTYTIRFTVDGKTETQRLTLKSDPRVVADGVTSDVLREQLQHNLRVRDLVSDVNRAVADLNSAKQKAISTPAGSPARLKAEAIERTLVTPPVRYSRPGLQAQIQYLYGAMSSADQKVSRDAVERYAQLRRELDSAEREIASLKAMTK
jgi:photosystem II stability/assembly factor-like uncharacterized protein